MSADATHQGAGGEVVLWSDVHAEGGLTTAAGTLSARGISQGGRIETSGHAVATDGVRVDAGASQGPGGQWLIDPYNYTIGAPQAATIVGALNNSTSVTVDTTLDDAGLGSVGAGAGNITVSAAIAKSAGGDATLTLKAHNDIAVNASLTSSSGRLGVVLWADQDNSGAGSIQVSNAAITTNGGQIVMGGGLDGNVDGRPDGVAVGLSYGIRLTNAQLDTGSGGIALRGALAAGGTGAGISMNNAALGTGGGQTGDITLTANSLAFSGTNALRTTGEVVIEPMATSFISALDLSLGITGASSLRIGKDGNTADVTLSSAASVAGPISLYGGHVNLNANLTSTATGDLFIKSLALDNSSLLITANILKTGGARSVLTLQSGGRINQNTGTVIQASGTALDVVMWSDYANTDVAGISSGGNIATNGGHLWVGGSSTNGGSLKWNGLTVGDGPSVSKDTANWNAVSLYGQVNTAGGDMLVWAGPGHNGGTGIAGDVTKPLVAGSGHITLLTNSAQTTHVDTTGHLTLAPYNGNYSGTMTWSGTMSGADLALTGTYNGLTIRNMATLGGLTLGQYSGLLQPGTLTPQVMGNSSDLTLAVATSVAGPIGLYGNIVTLDANLTSTATGDIFIKSLATGATSIQLNASIFKTGGARSTLTLQAGSRVHQTAASTIQASGTALDVVAWSDYGHVNTAGVTLVGNITTNGGHLWAGGSNTNGGSLTWNGLTVGDGPSVASFIANANAMDVVGQVNTGGGDILLWVGAGANGGIGLNGNSSKPLIAGSGNVTLLTNSVATLPVNTTGQLTLAPYNGSYGSTLIWGGAMSGADMLPSGLYSGLTIKNYATLGGLTLGQYSGMQRVGTSTPVVMGNSNDLTLALATSVAGPVGLYGHTVNLNTNLSSTGANAAVTVGATDRIAHAANVTVDSQGGPITYRADSDANGSGAISVGAGAALTSHGGAITLDAATAQVAVGIQLNGATVDADAGALTLTGAGSTQAVRVGAGSTVSAAAITVEGDGEVRLDSALTATAGDIRIAADRFVNTAGSSALQVQDPDATWQVHSRNADPFNLTTGDVRGGLVYGFKQYDYTAGDTVLGTGNGLLYSYAPILDVSVTGSVTRAYDGTVVATLGAGNYNHTGGSLVDGDASLSFSSTAAYTTAGSGVGIKDVGTGKTVSVTDFVAHASNGAAQVYGYRVNPVVSTLVGDITPRAITAITGITAASRIYDGTTAAVLTTSGAGFTGLVSGETLTVATATGTFADKNAALGKTVAITGLSLGGAAAGNYLLTDTTASALADITPKAIAAITGITAEDKVYNGNTAAVLATTGASFTGMIVGDELTVASSTGTFADKNVGSGKAVAITGLTLGGADAGNYTLATTTANTSAAITPKAIAAITGITAADKVYDGSITALLATTGAGFAGLVSGDTLSVASSTGAFADKHVGNGKTVAISGLTLGGADAGNYTLTSTTASTTATITPKAIAAITGITAADKVYDGNITALLATAGAGFTGMVGGDALTVASSTGVFADKHAGSGKAVAISGLTLGGADAGNYTLATTTANTTASITPKALATITGITAANKVYDGGTAATLDASGAGFTGMVAGDALTVASSTGAFSDKNVGTGKYVAISGLTLGGSDAGNYQLVSTSAATSADITPLALSAITGITGITAANKVYDGHTLAMLDTSGAGFTGMVSGDTLTVASSIGTFTDKNVGTGKFVAITGLSLGGADAGNYTLTGTTASTTADITPKAIAAITGITAADKVYDGGTGATLITAGAHFTGMVAGDALTVASGWGAFADKNAALGKTVAISGLSLGGADAGNYLLATPTASTSAAITPKALSAITGITASDKVYDGSAAATLTTSGAGFTGMISGDVLSVATGTGAFADRHAGTAKTVTISGLVLGGTDAGNYTLAATTASTTAHITPKWLTATASAPDKAYDGTLTAAPVLVLNGLVGGDTLGSVASGTFNSKDVLTAHTVTVTGIALQDGTGLASDYRIGAGQTASANVTPRHLTLSVPGASKVYDGSTAIQISGAATLDGVLGGDDVQLGLGQVTGFADKQAGQHKAVRYTGFALSGADVANYALPPQALSDANITPRPLVLVFTAQDKTYDGQTHARVLTQDDRLAGDTLAVGLDAAFADKNVGVDKTVAITGITLTGPDAGNYTVVASAQSQATIVRLGSVQWVGGATGDWFDPANWAGGAVPDLANVAVVHLPAGTHVSFDGAAQAPVELDALQGPQGQMTLGSGALHIASDLQLQQLTQTGGALRVGGDAIVDALTLDGTAQARIEGALTAPQYTQHGGSLDVGGDALIDALTQTGGALGVGGALTVAQAYAQSGAGQVAVAGATQITALQGGLTLGNLHSGGALTATSHSGAITQSAGTQLQWQGPARLQARTETGAPADIELGQRGNQFLAPVSLDGRSATVYGQGGLGLGDLALSGHLTAHTDGALNLGQGHVDGQVQGGAGQGIAQTGGLQIKDGLTLDGGQGDIVLDHPDNAWSGPVDLTAKGQVTTPGGGPLAVMIMQQAPVAPQRLPALGLRPAAVGQGAEMKPIVVIAQAADMAWTAQPIRFEVRLDGQAVACEAQVSDGVLTIRLPAGVRLTAAARQQVVDAALAAAQQSGTAPPSGIGLVTVALGGPAP
ncbi:MAG: YDG domain-containing protein [Proteobacteria bacterium]|nr:YDG domain-containing protein [Pseudomonadota bacterium]